MRSKRIPTALALAAVLGAGCGNYSNEDLEFMNALPRSGTGKIQWRLLQEKEWER